MYKPVYGTNNKLYHYSEYIAFYVCCTHYMHQVPANKKAN